jgi:hypothetical protein
MDLMAGARSRTERARANVHLAAYAVAWIAAGAIAVCLATALRAGPARDAALPPLRHASLESAARASGCRIAPAATPGRTAAGIAARPGVYSRSPSSRALTHAVQRGVVVIGYRKDLEEGQIEQVQSLQRAVPNATIVAPRAVATPEDVAATAYGRSLVCPRLDRDAVDTLRLFRGRYLGRRATPS